MDDGFWELLLSNFDVKLLVFARISGAFAFTPILSRQNFPMMMKAGLCLLITYIVSLTLGVTEVDTGGTMGGYVLAVIHELFIGFVIGFIMDMHILSIQIAGEIMDSQSGLGMAKIMDPSTRIQMSIYATFMLFILYMYFFVSNCHLTLISIFITSFDIIPLGQGTLNPELGWIIVSFFSQIFIMMLKLALPIILVEMIIHFCMGVLMKAVPQIQLMVINIQLMVIMGMVTLLAIAAPMADYIEKYVNGMMESVYNIVSHIYV
ncbi:MAG: flagellar biosynthetic protein FliR [Oscillospiraceae bacterium]|nr:flagellar biosynthetic protein FliR [Oscillospiraceae bacterium]